MKVRLLVVGTLMLLAITVLSSVVFAHHARAGYGDKDETLRGVVVEYKWKNPHVFITFEVKGDDGKVVQWVGELSSVTTMIGMGMTRVSLKPGDEIVVDGVVSKTGTPETVLRKVTKTDGTVVVDMGRRDLREP